MSAHDRHRTVDTRAAFEQLGAMSLSEQSMDSVLQTVADLTKHVLPGSIEASVSMLVENKPTTFVYTGQLALDLDESQYAEGYGPCLHAARTGEPVEISDARTDSRWPGYMEQAVARGSLSSLSLPLGSSEHMAAGLNVYAREAEGFDEDGRRTATEFARFAGVAVANMYAYRSAREMADNLEKALQSRAIIDQAKGVLIERHKLTPGQAFELLAQASMRTNRKLRDVADHLVLTGELLPPGGEP
jgi:GAF domain-containing protein